MEKIHQEKEEIQPIPDHVLAWLGVVGFINLYLEKIPEVTTMKAAYELAEADFFKAYKKRRYADYNTFIYIKWRYANQVLRKEKVSKKTK